MGVVDDDGRSNVGALLDHEADDKAPKPGWVGDR